MPFDPAVLNEDGSLSLDKLREWAIVLGGDKPAHVGRVRHRTVEEQRVRRRELEKLRARKRVGQRVKSMQAAKAAAEQLRADYPERYLVLLNRERIKLDLAPVEQIGIDSLNRPQYRPIKPDAFEADAGDCLHNMGLTKKNGVKLCVLCGTPIT